MTLVRFAAVCDICGRRSEEYSSWATCRECSRDACPNCEAKGWDSHQDADLDTPESCVCTECEQQGITDDN